MSAENQIKKDSRIEKRRIRETAKGKKNGREGGEKEENKKREKT